MPDNGDVAVDVKVEWSAGTRLSGDVERAHAEVADVLGSDVRSAPESQMEALVQSAQDASKYIHRYFTWDDAKAGHMYRLNEARKLTQAFVYIEVRPGGERNEYRAFVNPKGRGTYHPAKEVFSSEELSRQLVSRLRSELEGAYGRYRMYESLSEPLRHVDKAVKMLRDMEAS